MTITLARYQTNENIYGFETIYADIEQEKFCNSYKLTIYQKNESTAYRIFSGCYLNRKTARQAMNRHGKPWVKIYDWRNEK